MYSGIDRDQEEIFVKELGELLRITLNFSALEFIRWEMTGKCLCGGATEKGRDEGMTMS